MNLGRRFYPRGGRRAFRRYRQNFVSGFSDENRMFPLGGKASVFGYGGPAVRKDAKFFPSGVDHRFDREDHAGLHDSTGAELAVMADLRILVEADTYPVPAEFTHDAAALRLDKMLNCMISMPFHMESKVTLMRCLAATEIWPTEYIRLVSP